MEQMAISKFFFCLSENICGAPKESQKVKNKDPTYRFFYFGTLVLGQCVKNCNIFDVQPNFTSIQKKFYH